ncbi:MAG: hypothetical protein VKI83_04565 [Synechococcaceae cyanobacterium]|nr:hypothetical protein [Synechococcaceae cyanobacterium]
MPSAAPPSPGRSLTALLTSADPDGNGSALFSDSWQSSADGTSWNPVGTNSPSYLIASADQGKQLRLVVSHTDSEGFDEVITLPYGKLQDLPASSSGSRLTISDPLSPALQIASNGSPDRVELQAEVTATLHARSSSTWSHAFVAHNVGSPTAPGTGEKLPLTGLGRYAFVASAIPAATTTIVLEPDKNSAFFLHDAYSAFHSSLSLSPDSTGLPSSQRLLNVDTIRMGSAGGTSIVDLTSPDYNAGPTTVHGASRGTSIFWGTDADDAFLSGGGDAVIYGGLGRNAYSLGAGIDTLQYRLISGGSGATDRISGFDPSRDRLQLWTPSGQTSPTPLLSSANGSSTLSWGGHSIEFLGLPGLSLSSLTILQATAAL